MDILYVIGRGSDWDNNELRYSLRSIAKNGKNIDRVYIVGYKPDWVSDLVTYIPCDDPYDRAHKNILHKVLWAIDHSDIGSHFLISSDDHYYTKETDFDAYPVYYRYLDMPDRVVGRDIWSDYCKSLRETRYLLASNGISTLQTNPHCNTHFDVDVYKAHKELFDKSFTMTYGAELNCIMGNLLYAQGYEKVHFNDAKMSANSTMEEIETKGAESGCLSSTPHIENSPLAQYLRKHFPRKCKYEL